jgi:hypothetical protein
MPVVLTTPLEAELAMIIAAQNEVISTMQATLTIIATNMAELATLAASTGSWNAAYGTGSGLLPQAFATMGAACGAAQAPLTAAAAQGAAVTTANGTTHPLASKSTLAT